MPMGIAGIAQFARRYNMKKQRNAIEKVVANMTNLKIRLRFSMIIIATIGIMGLCAVSSGQYTWEGISFLIIACVITYWALDILFDRLRR